MLESNYESFVPFRGSGMVGKTVHEIGAEYGINITMIDGNGTFLPGSRFIAVGDHLTIRKMRNELDLW